MKNIKLLIAMFLIFIIISLGYILLKPDIFGHSVSEEECEHGGDDCWHSLAHQTFNKTYCLKIVDNETREHCLEYIPEVNKENK